MLDIRTLLLVLMATQCAQVIGWLLIARSKPRVPGAQHMLISSMLIFITALAGGGRGILPDWLSIVGGNIANMIGMSLAVYGVAKLFDLKPNYLVITLLPIAAIIFWPISFLAFPENVGIRIIVASLLFMMAMFVLGGYFRSCTWLPLRLRWVGVFFNGLHFIMTGVRVVHTALDPQSAEFFSDSLIQGIWFFQTIFYAWAHYILLLVVVGTRLSRELIQNNQRLTEEVKIRQSLQEELSASLAQESAIRREQRHFVDMVGHEFRTPLAVIDRSAEMIGLSISTQTPTPHGNPQIIGRIHSIRDAVRRLRLMIDTFLSEERLGAGKNALRQDVLNVASLLKGLMRQLPPGSDGRIHLVQNTPVPPLMLGDADMLAVIFANILDNSLKYAPATSLIVVTIQTNQTSVRVLVEDKGKGIPEKELPLVGNRFFRASNATTEPGTGLGLFTAQRLLAAHHGQMDIASRPGNTLVSVTLPRLNKAPAEDAARMPDQTPKEAPPLHP